MILLSAERISKSFSEKLLLADVSFYINGTDKVGIIGINGTGKTTLLNLLAGQAKPDKGTISKASGARIAYLQQNPVFDKNLSLLSIVLLHTDKQAQNESIYMAKSILTKLGFLDFDMNTGKMSEGEKKRVAIAQTLMNPCELLILDEPTNHLDNHMVQWLETFLQRYKGAMIMVTHDRYFLERVTNRIVEINAGALFTYDGNYSQFLMLKAQDEEMVLSTQRKNRSLYKRELEWMQRGARARSTKSKDRIERFNALQDGVLVAGNTITMGSVTSRLGKLIIEIDQISKSYDGRCIVKDFSYMLPRDARIGIIGRNGCGKSTLIKMMVGSVRPDSGSIIRGATVKIGCLSQVWDMPPDDMRVIDYIKEEAGEIVTNEGAVSAAKMLERFLFAPDVQWTPVSKLSGGEKRRLFLLRILIGAPNVLFLDEPTNDLDTDTLTVLEEYLEGFAGAVVTISHDRYFLDKTVDTIWEFRDGGDICQYTGGYSDYLDKRESEMNDADTRPAVKADKIKSVPLSNVSSKPAQVKFTFAQQREFSTIDANIAALEDQLSRAEQNLERYARDYEKLLPILAQKEKLQIALDEKMVRWVYLNELAEQIIGERRGTAKDSKD